MDEYISSNPQFIVNGFRCARIPGALDGYGEDPEDLEEELLELSDDLEDKPEDPEESEDPDDLESEPDPDVVTVVDSS